MRSESIAAAGPPSAAAAAASSASRQAPSPCFRSEWQHGITATGERPATARRSTSSVSAPHAWIDARSTPPQSTVLSRPPDAVFAPTLESATQIAVHHAAGSAA